MKGIITAIVLVGIVLLFVITNPSTDDYEAYLKQEMTNEAQGEDDLSAAFAGLFGGVAGSLMANASTRKNYVVCSVYTTDLGTSDFVALGILGNFFVLDQAE